MSCYIVTGSAQYPKEGTTNLHLDVSDATNLMVYVGYLEDEERGRIPKDQETNKAIEMARCDQITKRRIREVRETPGALWHIFDAVDADKIRDFLNKVNIYFTQIHSSCFSEAYFSGNFRD